MTKRKAKAAPKPARSPRIAAKAQRAMPAIHPKDHNDLKKEAVIVKGPATASQDLLKEPTEPDLEKGFDFYSATATARAYQAKLFEIGQANMQCALEYARGLAAIRSPVELLQVTEELTTKRIAMFRKYSSEMVELTTKR